MLFALVLLLSMFPILTSASASVKEDCNCGTSDGDYNTEDVDYIEGEEKSEVLRALENDQIFRSNVSQNSIYDNKTNVIELGESEYADENVVMVTSLYENNDTEEAEGILHAFLEIDSKKVLKLAYFDIDPETVDYKDFDENGTLMIHKEFSHEDFFSGELDNSITHYSYDQDEVSLFIDKNSFWYKFACGFSGLLACNAGCVASFGAGPVVGGPLFIACTSACQLVWGAGLC